MTVEEFNGLPFEDARSTMMACCASEAWAVEMAARRPYPSLDAVLEAADAQWWHLGEYGWLEAFRAHRQDGGDIGGRTAVLLHEYYATFGFGFVYCTEGKSSRDVLEALKQRVENRPEQELANSAEEQSKITLMRLGKLFQS